GIDRLLDRLRALRADVARREADLDVRLVLARRLRLDDSIEDLDAVILRRGAILARRIRRADSPVLRVYSPRLAVLRRLNLEVGIVVVVTFDVSAAQVLYAFDVVGLGEVGQFGIIRFPSFDVRHGGTLPKWFSQRSEAGDSTR